MTATKSFDISRLTLGEVAKVEELSGQSIASFGEDDKPMGAMLAALVFIAKRREQLAAGEKLTYSWNDACAVQFEEANKILGFTDNDEPAGEPADEPLGEPAPAPLDEPLDELPDVSPAPARPTRRRSAPRAKNASD